MGTNRAETAVHGCKCSSSNFNNLVDLKGNAHYHVAIVPNEWLSAYLDTLICQVFLPQEFDSTRKVLTNKRYP